MSSGITIIKKKKVYQADGHHGGAWKVAYADFVTAMMAFFLLMWLLNATTEEQRKGIADYFSPTIPVASVSGGGNDILSGDSTLTDMRLARNQRKSPGGGSIKSDKDNDHQRHLTEQVEALNATLASQDPALAQHISLKMSPEGLVIELTDKNDKPLFETGSAHASQLLIELVDVVANAFNNVGNNIKIVGHTDNFSFRTNMDYTNWELSTDRANTARKLLRKSGFRDDKIAEISGKSATEPVSDDPYAPENRRISITILH